MTPHTADLEQLSTNNHELAKQYPQTITLDDYDTLAKYALNLENDLELAKKENSILHEAIEEYEKEFKELTQ